MNCLVTYASTYGNTKRYAQHIAQELSCDILESKKVKPADLARYDVIIHGGGLYAGSLNGVKLLTKNFDLLRDKTLVLFSVGSGNPTVPATVEQIRAGLRKVLTPEMEEKIRFFHVRGGVDYPNLKLGHKVMMAMFHKMMARRGDALSPEERETVDNYGTYVDYVDLDTIQPLIDYVKGKG